VAAGVADLGQRVVFDHERHVERAGTDRGDQGRFQASRPARHRKSTLLEHVRHPSGRQPFLVRELGVRVDPM
jgi:hypothetical protein